jgi:hypothetical protein
MGLTAKHFTGPWHLSICKKVDISVVGCVNWVMLNYLEKIPSGHSSLGKLVQYISKWERDLETLIYSSFDILKRKIDSLRWSQNSANDTCLAHVAMLVIVGCFSSFQTSWQDKFPMENKRMLSSQTWSSYTAKKVKLHISLATDKKTEHKKQ